MLKKLDDLINLSSNIKSQKLVVVAANDDVVIDAVNEAMNMGIISPILIGPVDEIKYIINERKYNLNQYEIINSNSLEESSNIAIELIRNKKADIIMKGLIDTKILLKAVVNKENGIKDAKLLSHVAIFSFPTLDRILFATDCAMVIDPTVEEKIEIIKNAVKVAKTLGYNTPKVGIVSAVEKVNPKMKSTVDAAEIVKMSQEGAINDCIVDGPFAIDNLISMESVKHKGIKSEVAGNADILVFPNIESGNIFYKTSVFLANAIPAGIIVGATNPIVLTSRADSKATKLYSILLAMVYNHGLSNISN